MSEFTCKAIGGLPFEVPAMAPKKTAASSVQGLQKPTSGKRIHDREGEAGELTPERSKSPRSDGGTVRTLVAEDSHSCVMLETESLAKAVDELKVDFAKMYPGLCGEICHWGITATGERQCMDEVSEVRLFKGQFGGRAVRGCKWCAKHAKMLMEDILGDEPGMIGWFVERSEPGVTLKRCNSVLRTKEALSTLAEYRRRGTEQQDDWAHFMHESAEQQEALTNALTEDKELAIYQESEVYRQWQQATNLIHEEHRALRTAGERLLQQEQELIRRASESEADKKDVVARAQQEVNAQKIGLDEYAQRLAVAQRGQEELRAEARAHIDHITRTIMSEG